MFHSPTRADCRTYCKIMAVALAGSIGTLMLWTSLIVSITKWDVEIEAPAPLAHANGSVFEAGKRRYPPPSAQRSFNSQRFAPEAPQQGNTTVKGMVRG